MGENITFLDEPWCSRVKTSDRIRIHKDANFKGVPDEKLKNWFSIKLGRPSQIMHHEYLCSRNIWYRLTQFWTKRAMLIISICCISLWPVKPRSQSQCNDIIRYSKYVFEQQTHDEISTHISKYYGHILVSWTIDVV